MVPDYDSANKMMEKEYNELLREQYILFKYLNISLVDQSRMTSEDRKFLIEELIKEKEAEAEASKGKSQTPSRGPSTIAADRR